MISDKARLRKYEDDLNVSGTAVVILGLWSIVRVLIELFLGTKDKYEVISDDPNERLMGIVLVLVIIGVISFIIMKVHLYIGLNAMRNAKGMEYKGGYYIATIIVLVLSVLGLFSYKSAFENLDNIDTTIASMLVDLTTTYIFAVVILSTRKIKELRNKETPE